MTKVDMHQAKRQLSRIIGMAANGEEVIITKSGIPVARLIGYETKDALRQPGSLRGEVRIKNTFDKPLPRKLLALFEGKS